MTLSFHRTCNLWNDAFKPGISVQNSIVCPEVLLFGAAPSVYTVEELNSDEKAA